MLDVLVYLTHKHTLVSRNEAFPSELERFKSSIAPNAHPCGGNFRRSRRRIAGKTRKRALPAIYPFISFYESQLPGGLRKTLSPSLLLGSSAPLLISFNPFQSLFFFLPDVYIYIYIYIYICVYIYILLPRFRSFSASLFLSRSLFELFRKKFDASAPFVGNSPLRIKRTVLALGFFSPLRDVLLLVFFFFFTSFFHLYAQTRAFLFLTS